MTDWIGRTFTSETGWTHLETLVDIGNRMAGSAGEREAAVATRDALAEHARNAHLDEFEIQGWDRGTSAIVAGGTEQGCIALPRSPSGSASGPLVDLDHGLPDDFAGRDLSGAVVLVDSTVPDHAERVVHRREKYYRAVEAGAAAFVFANHYPGGLAPTGSVGTADAPVGEIPAVGVSKEVGARLARRFAGETVTVDVEASLGDATSQNVHAELGPRTDEALLVTAHVDAHDISEGAMDNGAGTAMVVELARALAAREDELDTRVRFVVFGAEEVGLVGSAHDAAIRDLDRVRAVLNLDGVAAARTLECTTHGFDALGRVVREVADRFSHPITIDPELGPHSDHWNYVQHGVPGYVVASDTGDSGRGWGHTAADTLDKLEARTFREQAILLTALAVALADDGFTVAHAAPADIAAACEAQDLAAGMRVTGDWPY
ncbi:Zn-dependent M28 family amino/carboxypeptidase [Halarchaeum solikamskense]|uniref:M28 family peptidase n=1 Tax=Halarchaeum nitratireducens TaxID=489913 RepID=UPI001B3B0359|nr:M28 family metallopeptidase [Halarchaeum solikamskense]MBP2252185.1 Zn-dependent M28 family amino/carboxypeptidase [Halarchaeum solikamskense]